MKKVVRKSEARRREMSLDIFREDHERLMLNNFDSPPGKYESLSGFVRRQINESLSRVI